MADFIPNISCILGNRTTLDPYWSHQIAHTNESGVVFLIIFLTGIPLNAYIINAIFYKRLYSNPTYLLLLNLGVTELLICLVTVLLDVISSFSGEISFGSNNHIRCQFCKLAAVFVFTSYLSSLNIMLISIERFVFFKSPLVYDEYITPKRTAVALLVIWTLSFCATLPPLIGYGDLIFAFKCGSIFFADAHVARSLIYVIAALLFLGVIVLVLIITNVWVVCIVVKNTKIMRKLRIKPFYATDDPITKKKSKTRIQMDKQIAKKQLRFFQVFGSILIINFITFIPAIVLIILVFAVSNTPGEYVIFVETAFHSQVALHPTMEVLLAPELRKLITNRCNMQRKIPRLSVVRDCFQRLVKCCGGTGGGEAAEQGLGEQL